MKRTLTTIALVATIALGGTACKGTDEPAQLDPPMEEQLEAVKMICKLGADYAPAEIAEIMVGDRSKAADVLVIYNEYC